MWDFREVFLTPLQGRDVSAFSHRFGFDADLADDNGTSDSGVADGGGPNDVVLWSNSRFLRRVAFIAIFAASGLESNPAKTTDRRYGRLNRFQR